MSDATFSSRIRELRTSLELTQTEFADRINTTHATLSSYENTDKTPSLDIVKKIAEVFTVSIDWLLGLSDIIDVNDTPRTYSDIIRMLFKLETANLINFQILAYEDQYSHKHTCEFSTTDPSMFNFANEWKKIKDLHDAKTIDDELYNLWIEKTLQKYDKTIVHPSDGFMEIPDTIDEELPFT